MTQSRNHAEHNPVEAFIDRWRDTGGKERANYQLFLTELCQLLDLPGPEPRSHRIHLEDLRDENIRQRPGADAGTAPDAQGRDRLADSTSPAY